MNNPSPSNKKGIIIVIVVIAIVIGVWYFYRNGSSSSSTSSSSLISSPDASSQTEIGANVLGVLNSVSSIKIDSAFFSSPVYESLVDFSIAVPPQSVGRPNPFAPTGSAAPAPAAH